MIRPIIPVDNIKVVRSLFTHLNTVFYQTASRNLFPRNNIHLCHKGNIYVNKPSTLRKPTILPTYSGVTLTLIHANSKRVRYVLIADQFNFHSAKAHFLSDYLYLI